MTEEKLTVLMKEVNEIIAILTASSKTAQSGLKHRISDQKSAIKN